jgi:hypothetical protein
MTLARTLPESWSDNARLFATAYGAGFILVSLLIA